MYFYMPTKIIAERDCVQTNASAWAGLGTKALIVTGKSSAYNGSLEDVTEALKKEGKAFVIYDKTCENPPVEMIMEIRDLGLKEGVDFVIGIGGGSPMDAAKAAALMIVHKEEGADYLYKKGADSSALPVVEVPTTCGTGSEATPYAILTVHERQIKSSLPHKVYPAFALVDGKYLVNAGRSIIVNTATDALGHFIESYINTNATSYSRMLCEYGMGVWKSVKNVLIGANVTAEDCDVLLHASTLAGMAIAHTGTSLPHGISYYLTYNKGIPHGKAVGYFLPGYVAEASPLVKKAVLDLIGFPDIQYFTAFIHNLIGPMEPDDALIDMAVKGLMSNAIKLKNCPYDVTEDMLYRICSMAKA